ALVGKLEAALYGFLRCLVELGFRQEIAACAFQNLFAAVMPLSSTFYAWHGGSPFCVLSVTRLEAGWASSLARCARQRFGLIPALSVGGHARDLCVVAVGDQRALAELALGLRGLRRKDVAHLGVAPLDLASAGLLEALGR